MNKTGGTTSSLLVGITKQLWEFCLQRQLVISAEYLTGKQNTEADSLSSDWKLNKAMFNALSRWSPFQIDICQQVKCSASKVHKLERRPGGAGARRIQHELGVSQGIRSPTILFDHKMLSESDKGTGSSSHSCPSVALAGLI